MLSPRVSKIPGHKSVQKYYVYAEVETAQEEVQYMSSQPSCI